MTIFYYDNFKERNNHNQGKPNNTKDNSNQKEENNSSTQQHQKSNHSIYKENCGNWLSNVSGWDKFNCIFDWFLFIIFVIYIFCQFSSCWVHFISQKLVDINQQLLKELDGSNF